MLRQLRAVFPLILLYCLLAAPVHGQECEAGVFADPGASSNVVVVPGPFETFEFYVVIHTENLVKAASYRMEFENYGSEVFLLDATYGPEGRGINIQTENGENVGLGECALGFGGLPVVVARYRALLLPSTAAKSPPAKGPIPVAAVGLLGNPDENSEMVVFADCLNQLHTCTTGLLLPIYDGSVATESRSFGQIKALY